MSNSFRWENSEENNIGYTVADSDIFDEISFHLYAYRMKNYKAFIDSEWIRVYPITVFYGDNSAGKSTIHQPLLLLKNALEAEKKANHYNFIGELDKTNPSFTDLLNKKSENDTITIAFKFIDDERNECEYELYFNESESMVLQHALVKYKDNSYDLNEYYTFENIFFVKEKSGYIPETMKSLVHDVMAALQDWGSYFTYMGPERKGPDRNISVVNVARNDIGAEGDNVYSNLLFDVNNNGLVENEFVQDWIREFGYELRWKPISNNIGNMNLVDLKSGISTNLIDNGYGVAQSLPVITAMSYLDGKTMLIDSPEAFLQTKMQSLMADFVIRCAKKKNSLILETSSQYLLYRLRRRIVEGALAANDVGVYYIDSTSAGDSKIINIRILDNGDVSPVSSFDSFFSSSFEDLGVIMAGGAN